METGLFDYYLPKDRIAQKPMRPRDRSRLLVLDRNTGGTEHRRFFEIGGLLKPGDILVVNDTKVFNARLKGRLSAGGRTVEVFLLRPDPNRDWIALAKPGKKLAQGSAIRFQNGVSCIVREKRADGTVIASFNRTPDELIRWTEEAGAVPIPPYVKRVPSRADDYQTVYAKHAGSAAAPTAGFHFTPELMEKLKTNGVRFAPLTLHAGLGTFRPVQSDTIEEHEMHEEWISIPEKTQKAVSAAKRDGRRVIAVGTTTVRALESGIIEGFTDLFITPGYEFKTVDALITNFHLPKSTLLVLVSAFAGEHHSDPDQGRKMILRAYEEAKRRAYRFYSFGDAMFIK